MKHFDIAASLRYGNIITHAQLICLYIAIGLYSFTPLICILFVVMSIINGDLSMLATMIIGTLVFSFLLGGLISIPIRDKRLKKKILPWLDDAIALKAYSKTIDTARFGFQSEYYKIEVTFVVAGKKYKHISGNENGPKAYHKIFRAYADREINILYSPKYDQVLILKD